MAIGGKDDDALSTFIEAPLANVQMWRLLYFDVAGHLQVRGWLDRHVMGPLIAREHRGLARELRLALALGPERVHWLLQPAIPLTAGEKWELNRAQLDLKGEEALELCIDTPRAAMRFVRLRADLMCRERQLRLDEQKLAEQKRQNDQQHEREMRRLVVDEAREENRAAALRLEAERLAAAREPTARTESASALTRPRGEFSGRRQTTGKSTGANPFPRVA